MRVLQFLRGRSFRAGREPPCGRTGLRYSVLTDAVFFDRRSLACRSFLGLREWRLRDAGGRGVRLCAEKEFVSQCLDRAQRRRGRRSGGKLRIRGFRS
jgi:hypothetical protein